MVAARLWASLVTDQRLPEGAVVFTSTSISQNSNWMHLFQLAGGYAAAGVVKRASGYVPISTHRVGQLRGEYGRDFLNDATAWREGIATLRALGEPFRDGAQDEQYLVSVVDEAHALINPEHPEGRGQFGFAPTLGPLAYHIIRTSMVSIFLMDSEQGFRDRENTSSKDIRAWASELGAEIIEEVSLAGAQFRCAGSKDYVDWVESMLAGKAPENNRRLAVTWYRQWDATVPTEATGPAVPAVADTAEVPYLTIDPVSQLPRGLDFHIFENPADMESALRNRIAAGGTARLLASYARSWKTKGKAAPHQLPGYMQDFHEPYDRNGERHYWSRIWNYVPDGSDYTYYIQGRVGTPMHADPLCEVGCPYAVRGFDFDYIGLLWFSDLAWRDGQWRVDAGHVFETGIQRTCNQARRERDPDGPAHRQLLREVIQGYRILMTRPMKGIYLWFEDAETKSFVEASLPISSRRFNQVIRKISNSE